MTDVMLQVTRGVDPTLAIALWGLIGIAGGLAGYLLGHRYGS
jgi:hypothetical protein